MAGGVGILWSCLQRRLIAEVLAEELCVSQVTEQEILSFAQENILYCSYLSNSTSLALFSIAKVLLDIAAAESIWTPQTLIKAGYGIAKWRRMLTPLEEQAELWYEPTCGNSRRQHEHFLLIQQWGKLGTCQSRHPWLHQPSNKLQHLLGHACWKATWLSYYKPPPVLISRCAGALGKGWSWTFPKERLNLQSVSLV